MKLAPPARVCSVLLFASSTFAQVTAVAVEETPIEAAALDDGSLFGWSFALDGNRMVVGAPGFGPPNDQTGAAFVFRRLGPDWIVEDELRASNLPNGAALGTAVAIEGDLAVASAPVHNGFSQAFVYRRSPGGDWIEEAALDARHQGAHDGHGSTGFGSSLQISGDTIAIGSRRRMGQTLGVGAVYVYVRLPNGTWVDEARIQPQPDMVGDFGGTLDLEGDRLLVGARGSGAVQFFHRSAGVWSPGERIQGGFQFGRTVTFREGGIAVAGQATYHGEVSVFEQTPSGHVLDVTLEPAHVALPTAPADFGNALDADGSRLAVGGRLDGRSGAVWIFRRDASGWFEEADIRWCGPTSGAEVGSDVAVVGSEVFAGAPRFSYLSDPRSGAVLRATLHPGPFRVVGTGDGSGPPCPCSNTSPELHDQGCANSTGTGARLGARGSASLAQGDLELAVCGVPPGVSGVAVVGTLELSGPFLFDGRRIVGGDVRRVGVASSDAHGRITIAGNLAPGVTPGERRFYQVVYRDPSGPCGSAGNTTNGLEVTFEP